MKKIELSIPADLGRFRVPKALHTRLQRLLDKQDEGHRLTPSERGEAKGLVEIFENLSYLRSLTKRNGK